MYPQLAVYHHFHNYFASLTTAGDIAYIYGDHSVQISENSGEFNICLLYVVEYDLFNHSLKPLCSFNWFSGTFPLSTVPSRGNEPCFLYEGTVLHRNNHYHEYDIFSFCFAANI